MPQHSRVAPSVPTYCPKIFTAEYYRTGVRDWCASPFCTGDDPQYCRAHHKTRKVIFIRDITLDWVKRNIKEIYWCAYVARVMESLIYIRFADPNELQDMLHADAHDAFLTQVQNMTISGRVTSDKSKQIAESGSEAGRLRNKAALTKEYHDASTGSKYWQRPVVTQQEIHEMNQMHYLVATEDSVDSQAKSSLKASNISFINIKVKREQEDNNVIDLCRDDTEDDGDNETDDGNDNDNDDEDENLEREEEEEEEDDEYHEDDSYSKSCFNRARAQIKSRYANYKDTSSDSGVNIDTELWRLHYLRLKCFADSTNTHSYPSLPKIHISFSEHYLRPLNHVKTFSAFKKVEYGQGPPRPTIDTLTPDVAASRDKKNFLSHHRGPKQENKRMRMDRSSSASSSSSISERNYRRAAEERQTLDEMCKRFQERAERSSKEHRAADIMRRWTHSVHRGGNEKEEEEKDEETDCEEERDAGTDDEGMEADDEYSSDRLTVGTITSKIGDKDGKDMIVEMSANGLKRLRIDDDDYDEDGGGGSNESALEDKDDDVHVANIEREEGEIVGEDGSDCTAG
ncbi:hypothetical protein BG004_005963 [Podila humilis]|nr:hypothetical protein BG004_005963 [Podila humilis]